MSKWISIEERLPDNDKSFNKNLLILCSNGFICIAYYWDNFIPRDIDGPIDHVTHWMSLSELPENK